MKQIASALLAAQKEMGTAKKDSANPFFKSKYADLNAIRETAMPVLNKHGIVVLQPTVTIEGKNYVKTLLLHESGESIEGLTEIIFSKANDAQAQGSGITYARRYGLQSLVNVGADDDDGNGASTPQPVKQAQKQKPLLQITDQNGNFTPSWQNVSGAIANGRVTTIEQVKEKFELSDSAEKELTKLLKK